LNDLGVREGRNVYIGTIHSFCLRHVVLPYARFAGIDLPKDAAVASESEQTRYFEDAVAEVIGVTAPADSWRTGFEKYRRRTLIGSMLRGEAMMPKRQISLKNTRNSSTQKGCSISRTWFFSA
jgi:hypothetical protein